MLPSAILPSAVLPMAMLLAAMAGQGVGAQESRCLTGNATGSQAGLNLKLPGVYTYYDGLTDSEFFPNTRFDKNHSAGWVPFAEGALTDPNGPSVLWAGYWLGHLGIDVVFDLKDEYVITGVKTLGYGARLNVSLKSEGEKRYTLVAMSVDPLKASYTDDPPARADSAEIKDINASARWVRVHLQNGRVGVNKIQLWGYPVPPGAKFPKKPFVQGEALIAQPAEVPFQSTEDLIVFPLPQEMKRTPVQFALTAAKPILYFPKESERCRTTAEVLQDEIARSTGLKLEVRGADKAAAQDGAIVIVEQRSIPEGMKPEGYTLSCGDRGVFISGADPVGAFYGTQSFLQLLRSTPAGWVAPGVEIRDWPECPIRLIQGRRELSENLVRALARFKINQYQIYGFDTAERDGKFVPFAERYCVKIMLPAEPRMLIGAHPEYMELNPGEKMKDLELSRANFCPSHPKLWDTYFAMVDKWIDKFNSEYVSIGFDEMYQYGNGSRYNVCDYCRARNLHSWELLGATLNLMADHFAKHGKKIYMLDTCFFGPSLSYKGDTDKDWRKALDIIPTNILMGVWHPVEVNELFAKRGFPQINWVNNPNGKKSGFPATTVAGARYVGMNVNMLDGPFSYRRFISMPQECWSPSRAYSADEIGGLALDKFMPMLRAILDGASAPSDTAKPEQFFSVDMKGVVNRSFKDDAPGDGEGWFDMGPNFDLRAMKPGRRELGGVPFDIVDESKNNSKGCLVLYNRGYMNPDTPPEAEVAVNRKAASLVFLHATMHPPGQSYLRRNEHAGFYFIVYEDNTYDTFDLKHGINIQAWLGGARGADGKFNAPPPLKRGRVAWRGETVGGHAAHLFHSEWINPRPDKVVKKVVFRSAWKMSSMNLAVVAVTGIAPAGNEPVQDVKLPDASDIAPLKIPEGQAIELRGGKEKSTQYYTAPDKTIVESSKPYREDTYHSACEDPLYSAYCAITDGNFCFQPQVDEYNSGELSVWLPEPVYLTGIVMRAPSRMERKGEDFNQSRASWTIEVSPNGKKWKAAGAWSLREEQGLQFFALPMEPVAALRIKGSGITSLKLYKSLLMAGEDNNKAPAAGDLQIPLSPF